MVQTSYQFLVEYFGAGTSPGVGCYIDGPVVPFLHGKPVASLTAMRRARVTVTYYSDNAGFYVAGL